MLGTIGQLMVLTAFVACGLSGITYFLAASSRLGSEWRGIARGAWGVMTAGVLVASAVLFYLLLNHRFEYAYVYQNTSRDLPTHFLVSAFWAGQEGSFLLWIVLNSAIGLALMRWAGRSWESPVMSMAALSQFFLLSMILGLQLGPLTLGSSPFTTLAAKFPEAPMLQTGFVPGDGEGLNDLLQNYWMAIHPPTLFVGFAAMLVPFAFAVTALWQRRYTEWVRPALPWTLFAVVILGIGIAMGGYWAYETLSFGGYWAWDPVENSSLVPWLTGAAAVHAMIIQKKSGRGHKTALLLSVLSFMLVIYSTFLTRSGILGDISVHSFVDLGLYNQLLLWILTIGVVGFGLYAVRYRELPTPAEEPRVLSREFMIFAGAMLLCAVAAVITLGTSSPILGRLFRDNPSSVPISFYNQWSLPLSVVFVFLIGLGQLFWWNKMSIQNVNRVLLKPIALSVASTVVVLLFTPFVEQTVTPQPPVEAAGLQAGFAAALTAFWSTYGVGLLLLLLLFAGFFALYGNGLVLWRIGRGNPRMAGGAISHIGFAVMILGIIASSGFSNTLGSDPTGQGRETFVAERGQTVAVEGYRVTYTGQEPNAAGRPTYRIDIVDPRGRAFSVAPVVYKSNKGQWIQHPDVTTFPEKDLFVAVSPRAMFEENETPRAGELTLNRGDSVLVGNGAYAVRFDSFDLEVDPQYVTDSTEIAVGANLELTELATGETRRVSPIYLIQKDRTTRYVQNRIADWNMTVTFVRMSVDSGAVTILLEGVEVQPEDWVVVQAYEKPLISLLWIGILMLSGGFCLAIYRRVQDQKLGLRRDDRRAAA